MAATVTANLTDVTLGESADDSYWTGEDGYSTEVYRQGNSAQAWVVGKNTNETASFDCYSKSGLVDMSATDTHLYITMRCDIAPFIDKVRFALVSDTAHGSSTSGTNWWTIVDNTTNLEWYGEWKTFILDVNSTSTDGDSSGTLSLAGVTDVKINVDNSNSGNIRSIENTYIDCVRFGTGLTVTGTAWDWEDVAAIDAGGSYKYDIIRKVGPGVFELNGQIAVGSGATTTTPSSTNETLFFKDPSTAGEAGGPLGKLKTGFYKLTIQGSGCTVDFNNVSVLSSSSYPFVVDADDTNLGTDSVDWEGGTLVECSSFLMKSSQSYKNLSFFDCGQIEPSTATFEGFLIDGYTGTDGAVLWGGGTSTKSGTITNCDRAIEVTQTVDQTYDGILFPSNTYDTHLNNGGTSIDIAKTNGSNPTNYVATAGGTVTYTASFGFDVEGLELNTEVTIVTAGTSTELHHTENATTSDGGGKYKITYTHGGGASVDVLIHHASYKPDISNIYGLSLPNAASTAKVKMFSDENYVNP